VAGAVLALADPRLYELLALVDALWDGKSRERELAARELSKRLEESPDVASYADYVVFSERLHELCFKEDSREVSLAMDSCQIVRYAVLFLCLHLE
jgi:vacuolar-type H+-ATPase catalytic subunit A/Vma1